ncbi:hypothetical protein SLS62_000230 [Diatrype stigma]|uniref:3'(2'),5'-bisphosphate nucleotidase n=1 Tax=Diatrype stigma TaxID=117547 RepID=A0AAN9V3R3_9PEZI
MATADLSVALRAVHRASIVTKQVLRSLNNRISAETKADASPVTIADFAAQALIISAIHAVYPDDKFVGEEDARKLRDDPDLAKRVWEIVQSAASLGAEHQGDRLASSETLDAMLDMIDLGMGENTRHGRVWVLDPVDGTATFMEGQQYAVCLCLLVDGVQNIGVIGCPNLSFETVGNKIHEDDVDVEGYGVIVSAVKGQGTSVQKMDANSLGAPRQVTQQGIKKDLSALDFVEATIGRTTLSQSEHKAVAESLGARWPSTVLWSQQMKYVSLALGATDALVRIPKSLDRCTHVWDHAGGHLLFEEAGGIIRDTNGATIDFGLGRRLSGRDHFGMVAAMPYCFDDVAKAVSKVISQRVEGDL